MGVSPLSVWWQHVAPTGVLSGDIWQLHKFPVDYVRDSGSVFGRRSLCWLNWRHHHHPQPPLPNLNLPCPLTLKFSYHQHSITTTHTFFLIQHIEQTRQS